MSLLNCATNVLHAVSKMVHGSSVTPLHGDCQIVVKTVSQLLTPSFQETATWKTLHDRLQLTYNLLNV